MTVKTNPARSNLRLLLVEDDYFIATEFVDALEGKDVEVVGPYPSLAEALAALAAESELDAAVLDVNLQGEMAFPLADALTERGIRFVFVTGYDDTVIPQRFAHITRCEKPADPETVLAALKRD